jgi:hypothetical protein
VEGLDAAEMRVRCRLAWNNWPDTPETRSEIWRRERTDKYSADAWDRVVAALMEVVYNEGMKRLER